MTRTTKLLSVLGAVVVLVAFYLLLFKPQADRVIELEEATASTLAEQTAARGRIDRLEDVRVRAAELEAGLTAAATIVPVDEELPSLIRQLDVAATDAGVDVLAIQPGRPEQATAEPSRLTAIPLQLQARGSYFQVVDFLRRLEDPVVTPRGIVWTNVAVTASDEYPMLQVQLDGAAFATTDVDAATDGAPDEAAGDTTEPAAGDTPDAEAPATTPEVE